MDELTCIIDRSTIILFYRYVTGRKAIKWFVRSDAESVDKHQIWVLHHIVQNVMSFLSCIRMINVDYAIVSLW